MRPEHWPQLLEDYITEARGIEFCWGQNDCVSWTAAWWRLMTGRDVFDDFRGRYNSVNAAKRTMIESGVLSMPDAGRYLYGEAKVPLRAGRGDIVLARNALGICVDGAAAFLAMPIGVALIPQREFVLAWTV